MEMSAEGSCTTADIRRVYPSLGGRPGGADGCLATQGLAEGTRKAP